METMKVLCISHKAVRNGVWKNFENICAAKNINEVEYFEFIYAKL